MKTLTIQDNSTNFLNIFQNIHSFSEISVVYLDITKQRQVHVSVHGVERKKDSSQSYFYVGKINKSLILVWTWQSCGSFIASTPWKIDFSNRRNHDGELGFFAGNGTHCRWLVSLTVGHLISTYSTEWESGWIGWMDEYGLQPRMLGREIGSYHSANNSN